MPYGPENLLAYEIGVKKVVKGVFHLNASIFYYDYKDFQAFTFAGLVQQIANRPATVKGGEIEFVATPTDNLDLSLGASKLDSKVKDVTTAVAGSSPLETVTRDRQMVLAPDYSLNGVARFHVPVLTDKELSFQIDSVYTGKQYFDLNNDPIATENGHAVTDLSISLTAPKQGWTVSIWSKNAFDRAYRMYAIPVTSLGFTQQMYGPPRWVGGTVSYKW
jgi:iron complex outermembrane receptor protein